MFIMRKILLVDDEKTFLESLSESLRNIFEDVMILTAENGEEAVRILNSEHINFLLTDLQMPVMDGYELLRYIKRLYPTIPVIVMTAHVDSKIFKQLEYMGCLDVIEKPIELSNLVERLKKCLYAEKGGEI